jgi:hypothetical protein
VAGYYFLRAERSSAFCAFSARYLHFFYLPARFTLSGGRNLVICANFSVFKWRILHFKGWSLGFTLGHNCFISVRRDPAQSIHH